MKKKGRLIQQGDVLIFSQDKLPSGLKKVESRLRSSGSAYVLADGETTGHAHVIEAGANCDVFTDEANQLWLWAKSQVQVHHEEHKTVTIDPGVYKIGIVREVDPFAAEIKKVAD